MELADLMMNELVLFDESIHSKNELFDCLAQDLEKQGRVTKAKKLVKDFHKREKEVSTGIEDGFGIPHAKSSSVLTPTVCFAHTGVLEDYFGLDGKPIEWVFAIVVPKNTADIHLDILSSLSRRLMDDDFRKQLKQATNKEEVFKVINN